MGMVEWLYSYSQKTHHDVPWKSRRIYGSGEDPVRERSTLISEMALLQRPRADGRISHYKIRLAESNAEGRILRQWNSGDVASPSEDRWTQSLQRAEKASGRGVLAVELRRWLIEHGISRGS